MPLTISQTPWQLGFNARMIVAPSLERVMMIGGVNHTDNASAIVTAVNNTYGKGINAAHVPEVRDMLEAAAQIIWNYKYAEATAGGSSAGDAKSFADNHADYKKLRNALTKAATL